MELILLEKIEKLGALGELVKVKDGYGRNFLVPEGKALPATKSNLARFEKERAELEKRQADIRTGAEALALRLSEIQVVLDRPAGSSEKLFGSVTNNDIADFLKEKGVEIPRKAIEVPRPIRTLGDHPVRVKLHPDVSPEIIVRVERSVKA
ncbi:MAG: 50S ribosomal protein L9 [Magnetococcales bacterium]|nr:50S ribosomal protein L9 [Magnetococcales bacterium]